MIVNADDFGLSPRVNQAIVRAFDEGLISSTTVMANMPAFAEASAIARDRGLLDHVGAHLVLTEGDPLTDTMRRCGRFCDADGRFTFWRQEDGRCGSRPTSGAPSPASCARRSRGAGSPVCR